MATLTIADLDNGKRDLETVDGVANSRAASVTTRYGQQTSTLYEAIRRLGEKGDAILRNLGYFVPVDYAPGLGVTEPNFTVVGPDGKIYAAQASALPFTTAAWNPDQWYPIQNDLNDRKLLVFDSLVEAQAAAATLPDGQPLAIAADEAHEGRSTRNTATGGAVVFSEYIGPELSGSALAPTETWDEVPQVSAQAEAQISASNAQAQALANRTALIKARAAFQFSSRAEFKTQISSEFVVSLEDGSTVIAGGDLYKKLTGATAIYDLPGWVPANGQGRFSHYGGAEYSSESPSAKIRHVRSGTFVYDIIELRNNRQGVLRKRFNGNPTAPTITSVRNFAQATLSPIVINCDGFGDGGLRQYGIQIQDGVLYQDWLPTEHRTRCILMMRDGTLAEADKASGISGAEWVARGAFWSIGFGDICVRNGAAVDMSGSYHVNVPSARTIIGQKPDGTILIVCAEGVTNSYGPGTQDCANLMASLGCRIAYICDGGGSTQCWWGGAYACPSSDTNFNAEREMYSFLTIDVTAVQPYDSGWISLPPPAGINRQEPNRAPVTIRQVGAEVKLVSNIAADMQGNVQVTVSAGFPNRYRPPNVLYGRGVLTGPAGIPVSLYMGAELSVMSRTGSATYAAGQIGWPVRWSGHPAQNQ